MLRAMPEPRADELFLLRRHVEALERRVRQLEQAATVPAPPPPPPEVENEIDLAQPTPLPASAFVAAAEIVEVEPADEPPVEAAALAYEPPPPKPPAVADGALEQAIGLRWAGWLGAVIVVIGAALAVKYAYDAGWLGRAPPELRLAGMAGGALGLLAAGEWAFRRVGPAAAVGLYAAGVATLFLVAYAGWAVLGVYGPGVAFALMGLNTLVGSAVAVRGRLVSVAVVALIGGNLAPVVAGGRADSPLPLLAYVLMLQLVAVWLAWWGGGARWRSLRWLSLVTTALWAAALLADDKGLPFGFALVYAAVFLAGDVVSEVRPRRRDTPRPWEDAVAFAVVTCGLLTLATLHALRDDAPLVRAAWLVGYAALFLPAGLLLRRAARPLSHAFTSVAAALAILAVPVAFGGATVVLTWGAMAVAFGLVGRKLTSPVARAASVAAWGAAGLYLAATWRASLLPGGLGFDLAGIVVPQGVVLSVLAGVAGLAVAWLLGPGDADDERPLAVRTLAALAAVTWGVGCCAGLPPTAGTLGLVLLAWTLVGLDLVPGRLLLAELAAAALVAAAVKWAGVDLLAQRLGGGWTGAQLAATPVLNPTILLGTLVSGSLAATYWLRLRGRYGGVAGTHTWVAAAVLVVAAALVTLGLTLEIDRLIVAAEAGGWPLEVRPGQLRQLAFTGLWLLDGLVVAAGLWWLAADPPSAARRVAGVAVVVVLLAAKYVLLDTTLWHLAPGGAGGTPVLNVEFLVGLALAAALAGAWGYGRTAARRATDTTGVFAAAGLAALVVVLWLGMLEIDRGLRSSPGLAGAGGAGLTFQAALTAWWAALAVTLVVAGLVGRVRGMRHFALALLAATLVKLFAVDLQYLDRGPRTVAFIVVGLLLLATSVLYGKYGARLLATPDGEAP